MTQTLYWIAVLALLSLWAAPATPPASFGPDEQYNGPRLNGGIGGEIRFAVEAVELPDGTALDR